MKDQTVIEEHGSFETGAPGRVLITRAVRFKIDCLRNMSLVIAKEERFWDLRFRQVAVQLVRSY